MDMETRKPNRLSNYDYSQNGAYFVTVCTKNRVNIFWNSAADTIVGEAISFPQDTAQLSDCGKILHNAINSISDHYPGVVVDKMVVMPNHFHLILIIEGNDGRIISAPTVSTIIGQTKRYVSKQIGHPIWQKSFHDHIIRSEQDYLRIWQYIDQNPLTWESDCFYTEN